MHCQEDALSGVTIGDTDKELQKSWCQSEYIIIADANRAGTDCLLGVQWCMIRVALIS